MRGTEVKAEDGNKPLSEGEVVMLVKKGLSSPKTFTSIQRCRDEEPTRMVFLEPFALDNQGAGPGSASAALVLLLPSPIPGASLTEENLHESGAVACWRQKFAGNGESSQRQDAGEEPSLGCGPMLYDVELSRVERGGCDVPAGVAVETKSAAGPASYCGVLAREHGWNSKAAIGADAADRGEKRDAVERTVRSTPSRATSSDEISEEDMKREQLLRKRTEVGSPC